MYYISPDPVTNETCNASGSTLRPCYSLQQLSYGSGLLLNKSAVTLHFLSGIHVLSQNHSLMLSDINEVEIAPWNQQQKELIDVECHSQKEFNIICQDIQKMNIISLNFTSCKTLLTSMKAIPTLGVQILIN